MSGYIGIAALRIVLMRVCALLHGWSPMSGFTRIQMAWRATGCGRFRDGRLWMWTDQDRKRRGACRTLQFDPYRESNVAPAYLRGVGRWEGGSHRKEQRKVHGHLEGRILADLRMRSCSPCLTDLPQERTQPDPV